MSGTIVRGVHAAISLILLFLSCWPGAYAQERSAGTHFTRGMNLNGWFTWPTGAQVLPQEDFDWPPFGNQVGQVPEDELRRLRALGFDFVRLSVDPAPYIFFAAERGQLLQELNSAIHTIRGSGLGVVVSFMPKSSKSHPKWNGKNMLDLGSTVNVGFEAVLADTAQMLGESWPDSAVALEIMNEPPLECNASGLDLWSQLAFRTYGIARKAAANLPLIVTGACYSDIDGLVALDAELYRDTNVIFTFHFYDPHIFTHQGQGGVWKPLYNLPYPSSSGDFGTIWAQVESQKLAASESEYLRRALIRYFSLNWRREGLRQKFVQVADWAKRNQISSKRILLGEFGSARTDEYARGPTDADRFRWIQDVRELAEEFGFPWAFWEYSNRYGMNFLLDDKTRELDPALIEALGLGKSALTEGNNP